jgi:tetratricopeptide (TPR) repeat protein
MATNKVPSYVLPEPGAQEVPARATLDQLPRVSQKLKLICTRCGRKHAYEVGTIFHYQYGEGETATRHFAFTNYFRCLDCGSPGPWDVADHWQMLGLALCARAGIHHEGFIAGRCALFDGTSLQTPAMGEDYLRGLLDKDPNNTFLCTRLGNLLRGCGERDRATGWYEKAIALDAGDIEARHHLYCFAVQDLDLPAAIRHALLLVRSLLERRESVNEELTEDVALYLLDSLRGAPPEFQLEFLGKPNDATEPPERRFIRSLLEQEGDDEKITAEFAKRLLAGVTEIPPTSKTHAGGTVREVSHAEGTLNATEDDDAPPVVLVPSLRDLIAANALNIRKLTVAVESDGKRHLRVKDRRLVTLYDGQHLASWPVASLRELCRGDHQPPADMDHYPEDYCSHFYFIEKWALRPVSRHYVTFLRSSLP